MRPLLTGYRGGRLIMLHPGLGGVARQEDDLPGGSGVGPGSGSQGLCGDLLPSPVL